MVVPKEMKCWYRSNKSTQPAWNAKKPAGTAHIRAKQPRPANKWSAQGAPGCTAEPLAALMCTRTPRSLAAASAPCSALTPGSELSAVAPCASARTTGTDTPALSAARAAATAAPGAVPAAPAPASAFDVPLRALRRRGRLERKACQAPRTGFGTALTMHLRRLGSGIVTDRVDRRARGTSSGKPVATRQPASHGTACKQTLQAMEEIKQVKD